MCNKSVESYPHALDIVSECYKTHNLCDTVVDTYPSTIKFVPECYKTQKLCLRTVHGCFFFYIPD